MANIINDGFEAGLGGWVTAGAGISRLSNSLTVARSGSRSFFVDNSSTAQAWIQKNITDSSIHVIQFYLRVLTPPTGSMALYQADCTAGAMRIGMSSARVIRAQIENSFVGSLVLNLDQWYRIDARFDTSISPAKIDWQVEGVVQTQITRVQPPALMTLAQMGFITAVGGAFYYDDVMADDSASAYPITTTNKQVFPGVAAGVGAAYNVNKKVNVKGGIATGIGVTFRGITGELTVVAPPAQGFFNTLDSLASASIQPDADRAQATGSALVAKSSVKVNAGIASGTGVAASAKILEKTQAEIASGVGIAANAAPVVSSQVFANAGVASGTGAAADPSARAVQGKGLTIFMGMS